MFRLDSLPAIPVHRRHGDNCDEGPLAIATRGILKGVAKGKTCWCAQLWSEESNRELGDLIVLERAAEAIAAEVELASIARRRDGMFAPFDPTVRKGVGEWSAVYLWRNGIKDKVNCAAFPATMAALCALRSSAFRAGFLRGFGGTRVRVRVGVPEQADARDAHHAALRAV